jgi:glutamate-1-semialdehyde aminotransferase
VARPYNRFKVPPRVRAIVLLTVVAAVIVFAYVQDRVTASGAREYVMRQREAIERRGSVVTIDEVMKPAVDRSVRQGVTWGTMVLVAGFSAATFVAMRRR